MKSRLFALCLMAFATVLFTACSNKEHYLPTSLWMQVNAEGNRYTTTFSFNGSTCAIQEATSKTKPLYDGIWSYYIDEDDDMHFSIETDVYDIDMAGYVTESYVLHCSESSDGTSLTLTHKPLIGSRKTIYLKKSS